MAAVAGLRGSGDFAEFERPKDFREMILWRNPNGTAPMTALMSKANKSAVADPEFNWWDEPVDLVRLQVNAAGGIGAAVESIVVDSADPSAAAPKNNWGLATHLVPGDVLLVQKTETATYDNELLLVTNVISATQFLVQRGFAGTTAATIADDAILLKVGSAYGEGTPSPRAVSRNPVKYHNLCQIFKTAYEHTGTELSISNLRTGDSLKNDKKRRMHDHARDIEFALMFGVRSESTDSNGKPLRTMGGLRSFIPPGNQTIFSTAVTYSSFLDAVSPVFDFESPAGNERIGFCGNGALNELNKIIQTDDSIRVNYDKKIDVYGMKLMELILPQGTVYFRTHPLLSRDSRYTKSMFVVDFSALRWRHTKGRDTHFQDNIQGNDEDTKKGQWFTEGGLEIFYGGLTCGYLGNISAT